MQGKEIRREFVEFFKEKGHKEIKAAPVVPFDDPTLLFINAGMNQFKDVFLGKKDRTDLRVVNSQKCIRAGGKHNDLDEVGKDSYHHTFFEMLGNWSFGDYYKREAIIWAWELLTKRWKINKELLFATVHHTDSEAFQMWQEFTDIDKSQIEYHGDKDNFWEMGDTGPCGPCSEIHIDRGESFCELRDDTVHKCRVNGDCSRFIELWNLVFIQYYRDKEGNLNPLQMNFVDTGAGFERICQVLQGKKSNYDIDIFQPIIKEIEELSGIEYPDREQAFYQADSKGVSHRVIADHIRTLCIALSDGGYPSNEGRGYVLRRILRRAARYGRLLGLTEPFLYKLASAVTMTLGDFYPELGEKEGYVKMIIQAEEERFNLTLDKGLLKFNEIIEQNTKSVISGKDVFLLYDTYGFPPDLTAILAEENSLSIDEDGFQAEMDKQRRLARESSQFRFNDEAESWTILNQEVETQFLGYEQKRVECHIIAYSIKDDKIVKLILDRTPFYAQSGGQIADKGKLQNELCTIEIDDVRKENNRLIHYGRILSGEITGEPFIAMIESEYRKEIERNHTATHLLHSILRELLGDHVQQKGSLVAASHLRFDFTHYKALTEREIELLERMMNRKIRECLPVSIEHTTYEKAKSQGAIALFGEKYEEEVRTIKIGEFSHELCGGTHLDYTGEIGLFKIASETAIASGIRRVEAITGSYAEDYVKDLEDKLSLLAQKLSVPANQVTDKLSKLVEENRQMHKELESIALKEAGNEITELISNAKTIEDFKLVIGNVKVKDVATFRSMGDELRNRLQSGVAVLGSVIDDKASLLVMVTKDLTNSYRAGDIVSRLAEIVDGKGGGRPDMAMAGGRNTAKLEDALEQVEKVMTITRKS